MRENRPMPNASLRALFLAIEEVMGANGAKAVLNLAGLQEYINNYPPNNTERGVRFTDYGKAQQAVEDFYGGRGARAMLTQIGRATFRYTLEEQPTILGLAGLAMRMFPEKTRINLILNRMVKAANNNVNLPSYMEEDDDAWYYVVEQCPCQFRERSEKGAACYTTVGTLQEAIKWITGKHYRVQEIECLAVGGNVCKYRIDKKAQQ
ncbi:MAG: 4-vinyl reductase [Ardenticatenaceae bacterium]